MPSIGVPLLPEINQNNQQPRTASNSLSPPLLTSTPTSASPPWNAYKTSSAIFWSNVDDINAESTFGLNFIVENDRNGDSVDSGDPGDSGDLGDSDDSGDSCDSGDSGAPLERFRWL